VFNLLPHIFGTYIEGGTITFIYFFHKCGTSSNTAFRRICRNVLSTWLGNHISSHLWFRRQTRVLTYTGTQSDEEEELDGQIPSLLVTRHTQHMHMTCSHDDGCILKQHCGECVWSVVAGFSSLTWPRVRVRGAAEAVPPALSTYNSVINPLKRDLPVSFTPGGGGQQELLL